jgi:hypothetical protein
MLMVMFILSLLLGAVFGVVRGTLELSTDLTQAQASESRTHGFARVCETTFRNLPAGALARLRLEQRGRLYLSSFAFKGAHFPLGSAGTPGTEVTVIESEEQVDGYQRIILRCLTAAQALAWEKGDRKAGTRLVLLEDVSAFEWRIHNPRSGEWEPVWNPAHPLYPLGVLTSNPSPETPPPAPDGDAAGPRGPTPSPRGVQETDQAQAPQRPHLVELRLGLSAGPVRRWLFWIPPAERPR